MVFVHHVLLALFVLRAEFLFVQFDSFLAANSLVFQLYFVPVLEVFVPLFPLGNFLHEIGALKGKVLDVIGLFFKGKFDLIVKGLECVNFLGLGVSLVFEVIILFEEHLIFELEVFSSFKFDSKFADLILWDSQLIFKTANFTLVVVKIVFGQFILVDTFF